MDANLEKHIQNVQEARQLFGLDGNEWSIIIRPMNLDEEHSSAGGISYTDVRYLDATIGLSSNLDNDMVAKETAYHEVLHVAHAEIDSVVREALIHVPKQLRKTLQRAYEKELEQFLQRMSRSIVANVRRDGTNNGNHENAGDTQQKVSNRRKAQN